MREWMTWRGQPNTPPTNDEMRLSCRKNAEDAAQRVIDLGNALGRLDPGDQRIRGTDMSPGIMQQISAAKSDIAHWREYERHYRDEAKKEAPPAHWSDGAAPDDGEVPF